MYRAGTQFLMCHFAMRSQGESFGPEENQLLGLKVVTSSTLLIKKHISPTMTDHGDDCYFFYYSTCTKVSNI